MRELITTRTIAEIKPIPGADRIEAYRVDGWWVVDGKGKYKVGDAVLYCEIDSFLPIIPEFEFLKKSSYKNTKGMGEGYRLKTVKLRGQISQGLLLPLEAKNTYFDPSSVQIYIPDLPEDGGKVEYAPWPTDVPKTSMDRIQNLKLEDLYGVWEKTEKLDGYSCTLYKFDNEFGICSHSWGIKSGGIYHRWLSEHKDIPKTMHDNTVIQGELIGPGIQRNKYKLNHLSFRAFRHLQRTETGLFVDVNIKDILHSADQMVPYFGQQFISEDDSLESLLELAEGYSGLGDHSALMEGLVFSRRVLLFSFVQENPNVPAPLGRQSFKIVANSQLLN